MMTEEEVLRMNMKLEQFLNDGKRNMASGLSATQKKFMPFLRFVRIWAVRRIGYPAKINSNAPVTAADFIKPASILKARPRGLWSGLRLP